MQRTTKLSIVNREDDKDMRERMSRVRALVADRDTRTASLVQRIIFSLGIRNIEVSTDGDEALKLLKSKPYDFIITEWNMHPFDGITLVKTIRAAKEDKRIRRDIPIIMLTALADMDHVQQARDAGISEFIAKPFSAKTISDRIIQIIDNPRAFVDAPSYAGPCRRRRGTPPEGIPERRAPRTSNAQISPPDYTMLDKLGIDSIREVITENRVEEAQQALMDAKAEFVEWAREDIRHLNTTYQKLLLNPDDIHAQFDLKEAAYAIQSRAGTFQYDIGTEVGGMLVSYIAHHPFPTSNHLRVIGKQIETLCAVFNEKIEKGDQALGRQLVDSLRILISKLE